jgi:hypothetical protein
LGGHGAVPDVGERRAAGKAAQRGLSAIRKPGRISQRADHPVSEGGFGMIRIVTKAFEAIAATLSVGTPDQDQIRLPRWPTAHH